MYKLKCHYRDDTVESFLDILVRLYIMNGYDYTSDEPNYLNYIYTKIY